MLSCDVIIWDDNTPFLFFLKTSLTHSEYWRVFGQNSLVSHSCLLTQLAGAIGKFYAVIYLIIDQSYSAVDC
jgi:hypothetical protein